MTVIPFPKPFVRDLRNGAELPNEDDFEPLEMYPPTIGPPAAKIIEGVAEAVRGIIKLEEVRNTHPDLMASHLAAADAIREVGERATALLDDLVRRRIDATPKLEG